jgi:putative molybdopterin biosynthesis protein
MKQEKRYLTTKEVARLLNVHEKAVYRLIHDKQLPAIKVTGKWLFPQHFVEEWLDIYTLNHPRTHTAGSTGPALLVAGSDDLLLDWVVARFNSADSDQCAFFANTGSMGGLHALRSGLCHIAGCHLLQDDNDEYNFRFAEDELSRAPVFINLSKRRQGLLLAPANPHNIGSIKDLARPGMRIVNRPINTGTRLLLDYELSRADISPAAIAGYDKTAARHFEAGVAVLKGWADAAPAIEPVAEMLGLDFLPLRWERFDLLVDRDCVFDDPVQRFLQLLTHPDMFAFAGQFSGYDLSMTGRILYPERLEQ